MKKSILYVITKSNWGGAQRYVYDLATAMSSSYEVSVASQAGDLLERLAGAGIAVHTVEGLKRDIDLFDELRAFWSLFKLIRRIRPDILHLNSSKAAVLGALSGRLAGVPAIVFTAHGWVFNEPRARHHRSFFKLISWMTIMLCHSVITVSKYDHDAAHALPFAGGKLRTIHNGVSEIADLSREKAREELVPNASEEELWIGSVAELTRNKGLRYGIEAMKIVAREHPRARYVIVGEGELRDKLERLADKLGLSGNVTFAGARRNAERLYGAFDVVLMPSLKEGLPYALLEAGAAGRAVVASQTGGIPEILAEGAAGVLVSPAETARIAQELSRLIRDKELRDRFGKILRERIRSYFTLEAMRAETERLYRELLAPHA